MTGAIGPEIHSRPLVLEPYQPTRYAGFWIRAAAGLIDGIILVIPLSFTVLVLAPAGFLGIFAGKLLIFGFYETHFYSSAWMGTPGMKILGIKIVDYSYRRIDFDQALSRLLAEFVSGILLGIGYIMIAFDKRHQGLHDQLARTYVIRSR